MTIELLSFGIIAGFIGGFFGVGGGMVLIPMLLYIGFDMKSAIGISIIQMVFTSLFGTYLNFKHNRFFIKDALYLGMGGFVGGLLSGIIVSNIPNSYLEYLFLSIVLFAIFKVSSSSTLHNTNKTKSSNIFALLAIGFVIGLIAMSIGVGGSIMLTPILVGYLYYNLKDISSMALFFVVFSSIAGLISLSINSSFVLYLEGSIVGISSLMGVYFGIKLKHKINLKSYKKYLLLMYVVIFVSVLYKIGS
jgi:uncharacterized membrane protein YfcA